MARVKGAMMARKRRNKTLKLAKGYWGAKSKHFKMANEQVMKSLTYAYVGRRLKKRDFRQLWITRISAACKLNGMNYSTFMHGLKVAGIQINRKMLSEMAINDEFGMVALETVTNQYLGGDASLACSPETQTKIDRLVVELVERQHQKALQILRDDRQKLDELARFLHEKETITGEEFMSILNA